MNPSVFDNPVIAHLLGRQLYLRRGLRLHREQLVAIFADGLELANDLFWKKGEKVKRRMGDVSHVKKWRGDTRRVVSCKRGLVRRDSAAAAGTGSGGRGLAASWSGGGLLALPSSGTS